jgi:hypothetical protein
MTYHRAVPIIEDRARSSTLVSSDFSINFVPSAFTAQNEPISAIAYSISGRWDSGAELRRAERCDDFVEHGAAVAHGWARMPTST